MIRCDIPRGEYIPESGIYHVKLPDGLLVVSYLHQRGIGPEDDIVLADVDLWIGRLKKFSRSFRAKRYGVEVVNNFYADLEDACKLGLLDMDLIDDLTRLHFDEPAVSDPVEPYNDFILAPTSVSQIQ